MEKSKLGLSVPVMGALTFILFLFGGYVAGLIFVGYILLREEDAQLKKTALTAVAAAVLMSLASAVIGFLPDVVNVFESLLAIFTLNVYITFVDTIFNFLHNILNVLRPVVMLGLAVLALLGKPLKLKFIDKLMD